MRACLESLYIAFDATQRHLEPGQTVFPNGPDRELTLNEFAPDQRKR